jgi:class 3 adenylate cyclase
MACGGLKFVESCLSDEQKEKSATDRTVEVAVEFMKYAKENPYVPGKYFVLKIGVHYGNCIFGVLGYHKPQFSLIGDTVNTTSRFCTTGVDDSINLSETAWEQIEALGKYSTKVKIDKSG